jgi:hypothetical protein
MKAECIRQTHESGRRELEGPKSVIGPTALLPLRLSSRSAHHASLIPFPHSSTITHTLLLLLSMTDSQFLYQLMLRVNEARATHPPVPMWRLLATVTALQRQIDSGRNAEQLREKAIKVAGVALRLAVEVFKG